MLGFSNRLYNFAIKVWPSQQFVPIHSGSVLSLYSCLLSSLLNHLINHILPLTFQSALSSVSNRFPFIDTFGHCMVLYLLIWPNHPICNTFMWFSIFVFLISFTVVNTFKYHVFAPMGRFQLELIYLYFPPSSHLIYVCFCPPTVNCSSQETEVTSTPTRPVDNVVITTKGLQDRNIHILDGRRRWKIKGN